MRDDVGIDEHELSDTCSGKVLQERCRPATPYGDQAGVL